MKNLDDLVFKNLHGLKDEEDEVKHKHEKKSPETLDPKIANPLAPTLNAQNDFNKMYGQQQQQMMYNYYANMMIQQRQQLQGQTNTGHISQQQVMNPALLQNMQNMQSRQNIQGMQAHPQFAMNTGGVTNAYGPTNMGIQGNGPNQYPQMNRMLQGQTQMGLGGTASHMQQLPGNPQALGAGNISQLPPNVQAQMLQMYQLNQMKQASHNNQYGQINQVSPSPTLTGQAGLGATLNTQMNQNFPMYRAEGITHDNSLLGPNRKQSADVKKQFGDTSHHDEFGDFLTSNNNISTAGSHKHPHSAGHPPSHFNGSLEDGFSDFQDASRQNFSGISNLTAPHGTGIHPSHQKLNQGIGGFSAHQQGATDDFDDFQDATPTGKVGNAPNPRLSRSPDDGFDDFKDASAPVGPQGVLNSGNKWDLLDDFVEKKPEPQPASHGLQPTQIGQPPQTFQQAQGSHLLQTNFAANQQAKHLNVNPQVGQGQQGHVGFFDLHHQAGVATNVNLFAQGFMRPPEGHLQHHQQQHHQQQHHHQQQKEDDEFEEFEEAKPNKEGQGKSGEKAKQNTKEDLMFGALENKMKKTLGYGHAGEEPSKEDDFGDFEAIEPQKNQSNVQGIRNVPAHVHGSPGDDFDDFKKAETGAHNNDAGQGEGMMFDMNSQANKKLTIYDIDLAEFGITETTEIQPPATNPQTTTTKPEQVPAVKNTHTNQQEKEDFGDFVEINEENFQPTQEPKKNEGNVFDLYAQAFGVKKAPEEEPKKAAFAAWAFEEVGHEKSKTQPNVGETVHHGGGDDGFDEFDEPQVAKPQEVKHDHHRQEDFGDFDDFQVVKAHHDEGLGNKHPGDKGEKETKGLENDWYADFMQNEDHGKTETKEYERKKENEEARKQTHHDIGFDFGSVTVPTGNHQTDIFGTFDTANHEVQHPKEEKKEETNQGDVVKEEEDFDDFEDFQGHHGHGHQGKKEQEEERAVDEVKGENKEEVAKQEEEQGQNKDSDDEEFGDFGGEPKPHVQEEDKVKTSGKKSDEEEEEQRKDEINEEMRKKLTIYDIDLTEFGIEEQQAQAQMELNLGLVENLEKDNKKESGEQKKPKTIIADLYGLYDRPAEPIEQPKEDLFAGFQTNDIVVENQPKLGGSFHWEDPQETKKEVHHHEKHHEHHHGHQHEHNQDQENDEDFDDFEVAAPGQESPNNMEENQETPKETENHPNIPKDISQGFEAHNKKEDEDEDNDFGDFEDISPPSKPGTHQDIKEEPKFHVAHEENEHDDFDNFEVAVQAQAKPEKENGTIKSLSHVEGQGPREASDFGSLAEVTHMEGQFGSQSHQKIEKRDAGLVRNASLENTEKEREEANNDFGSLVDVDKKDKNEQKDESIFNPADSSDYSPPKDKEKDTFTENEEDFGDFVASKQDLAKEKKEESPTQKEPVEVQEQYVLESVLAEYGIEHEEKQEEVEQKEDYPEEIEKRTQQIQEEYEKNLFKASSIRAEIESDKFKPNKKMIEDLVQELISLQKYKEAIACEKQIKVLQELDELNETKRKLIEDEQFEEVIRYRDLIKNKEKEVTPKQRFEELLSYYDNEKKSDYRIVLLEDLKATQVPAKYIYHFYERFLGKLKEEVEKQEEKQEKQEKEEKEETEEKEEKEEKEEEQEKEKELEVENNEEQPKAEEGEGDVDGDGEEKRDGEGEQQPAEEKLTSNDEFDDFEEAVIEPPKEVKKEDEVEEVKSPQEVKEEKPLSLPDLQKLKEEATKWALLVKVMYCSGIEFKDNVRKVLNQIIYEAHKFYKISDKILRDNNTNAINIVLSSQKYENFIKGIQLLISFYKELKAAYEFLNVERKALENYDKAVEDLVEKVEEIKDKIRNGYGKEYVLENMEKKTGEEDLMANENGLGRDLLCHVCHLSLKLSHEEFTAHSEKYYFLPYLNFLLSIA